MSAANIAATLGDTARDAAARWLAEGHRVRIATSPEPGTDFNDALTGRAATKGNDARHASPNAIGTAEVQSLIGAAPEMTQRGTWPAPDMQLITDGRPSAPALDDDALPAGWQAWITAEAAARACPRDYAAARIGAASAWIGNAGRIAATADRLDNTAELCCSRPSLGRAFLDIAPV
jgi:hypothetical protein